MNPNAKGKLITLSGHMDTVHPVGSFGSPATRIECDRNLNLLNKMNEIFKLNNMPTLIDRLSTGGSDAAEVTEHGIPCVDSVGVLGDFVHTRDEYAEIRSLKQSAKRIAAVVYGLED